MLHIQLVHISVRVLIRHCKQNLSSLYIQGKQYANHGDREDCYHLSRLLPDFDADEMKAFPPRILTEIFTTFANLRQARTSALVKGARAQGESRVIDGGTEACAERDERLRKGWEDEAAVEAKYDALFKEPF